MPQEEPGRAGQADESSIPKDRFDAAVGKERSRADKALAEAAAASQRASAAEARLSELQQPTTPPAADVTLEQIEEAVDEGKISRAQGNQLIVEQTEKRMEQKLGSQVKTEIESHHAATLVQTELDQYTSLVPGLKETGSDSDLRAGEALLSLTKRGFPDNTATKVAACMQAFGSLESLQANPLPREAHPEVGGGRPGGVSSKDEDVPPEIAGNPRLKAHYTEMIDKGQYTGWDDKTLRREMEFVQ